MAEVPRPRPPWARRIHEITHELRAPLASMGGYADLLHRRVYGALTADQARAVEAIYRRSGELRDRLDQIAEWLYLVGDEGAPAPAPAAVSPLVREVAAAPAPPGHANAEVRCTARAENADVAWVVQDPLRSALRSLLRNAGSAAASRVTVTVDRRGDRVVVEIEDDGPGLPSSVRATLLEPGGVDRGDAATGLGLGIPIARGWIEAMGGDLTFLDAESGGTVAVVGLRAADPEGP